MSAEGDGVSASDYRELPERVAAAFAAVIDARRRAARDARCCLTCGKIETLRFDQASARLTREMLAEYAPTPPEVSP